MTQEYMKSEPLFMLYAIKNFCALYAFTHICTDFFNRLVYNYKKDDRVLDALNRLQLHNRSQQLEVAELRNTLERLDNYVTQIHFQLCVNPVAQAPVTDNDSQTDQSQTQEEQSQEEQSQTQDEQSQEEQSQGSQTESSSQTATAPQELQPIQKDKHALLIEALKDGETVSMNYKKQTFNATFTVKAQSQHGYVLKANTVEYNTPSHFSHNKKQSINEKIRSDNGWETVYVLRDGKKVSLNDLLAKATG